MRELKSLLELAPGPFADELDELEESHSHAPLQPPQLASFGGFGFGFEGTGSEKCQEAS
jgi:hypothetical protein